MLKSSQTFYLPLGILSRDDLENIVKTICNFKEESLNVTETVLISPFINNVAFRGDISCDFESPLWRSAHCSWDLDFASTADFTWMTTVNASNERSRWRNGKFRNSRPVAAAR